MNSVSKSDIDKTFGKILKDFRIKNKLTQDSLSENLGISLKYISRIENGYSGVKTQTLIKYMNLLGLTPNILYADFIDNEKITKQIELSQKISELSDKQIEFLIKIIDILQE